MMKRYFSDRNTEPARSVASPKLVELPEPAPFESLDVQRDLVTVPAANAPDGAGGEACIKVDAAYRIGHDLYVAGWNSGCGDPELVDEDSGRRIEARVIRTARADAALHLRSTDPLLGFVLVAHDVDAEQVCLLLKVDGLDGPARYSSKALEVRRAAYFDNAHRDLFACAAGLPALRVQAFTKPWLDLLSRSFSGLPVSAVQAGPRAALELAGAFEGGVVIAAGWAIDGTAALFWLEDDAGTTSPFTPLTRLRRLDIESGFGNLLPEAYGLTGYVARIAGVSDVRNLSLKALDDSGVHTMSRVGVEPVSSTSTKALEWLQRIGAVQADVEERHLAVELPLLDHVRVFTRKARERVGTRERVYGSPMVQAQVALFIDAEDAPYRTEHQLMELARDPWVRAHVCITLLVRGCEDSRAMDRVVQTASELHGASLRLITTAARGDSSLWRDVMSSAADAPTLAFLSGMVVPLDAGWLQRAQAGLDADPSMAALSPVLRGFDGSKVFCGGVSAAVPLRTDVQSASASTFSVRYRKRFYDASRGDGSFQASNVLARDCLIVRREALQRAGGWRGDYLDPAFDALDLCQRLRRDGGALAVGDLGRLVSLAAPDVFDIRAASGISLHYDLDSLRYRQRWACTTPPVVSLQS